MSENVAITGAGADARYSHIVSITSEPTYKRYSQKIMPNLHGAVYLHDSVSVYLHGLVYIQDLVYLHSW